MMVVCGYKSLVAIGLECSTFVFMSSGTTRRSVLMPMGDTTRAKVVTANTYASRHRLSRNRLKVL